MTSLNERQTIKVGSRKSELALVQTKHVIASLQVLFPNIKFEIHSMTTMGDRVLNKSLPKIGEKALFTKDLEEALTHGGVDFVVHSLKDLPTQLPMGMAIGAVLQRDDPRDALVLNNKFIGSKLRTLPKGSVIGTSSLRRAAQLSRNYKHLKVIDIRGNLNTRLAKLDAPQSKFSGIILANAGLIRMGWSNRVSQVLEPEELLYAVGQGALAVECRVNDPFILNILHKLCDLETQCRIITERSFLKTLGGGCSAPVAVCTNLKKNSFLENNNYTLDVDGAVWSLDGKTEIVDKISFNLSLDTSTKDAIEDKNAKLDVITTKRVKLSDIDVNLKTIPVIGNENVLPCSSSKMITEKFNITDILNIHGKMFDQCPFTGKYNKISEHQDFIGQDFMGDCPVLNIHQKVSYDLASIGAGDESSDYRDVNLKNSLVDVNKNVSPCSSSKIINDKLNNTDILNIHGKVFDQCPFTGKFNKKSEHQDITGQDFMGDRPVLNTYEKVSYDSASVGAGEAFSCPVISKLATYPNVSSEQMAKCPFFTNVELIDYEANNKGNLKRKSLVEDCMTNEDSVDLFCGLYCHKKHLNEVFQMCENMGINLANKLISAGALAVMKIAQSEIHSKS